MAQPDAELQSAQASPGVELTDARRKTLMAVYKKTDEAWRSLNASLQKHLAAKPQPKLTTVMVSSEGVKPIPNHGDGRGFPHFYKDAFFLKRGDVNQKQGVADGGILASADANRFAKRRRLGGGMETDAARGLLDVAASPRGCRLDHRYRTWCGTVACTSDRESIVATTFGTRHCWNTE